MDMQPEDVSHVEEDSRDDGVVASPQRSDFEALAGRVLALAQHGEHYMLDLIDAAVYRVHPEDVEAKAKRIAARVLTLVGADGWWHHDNINAAVTVVEGQANADRKATGD